MAPLNQHCSAEAKPVFSDVVLIMSLLRRSETNSLNPGVVQTFKCQ